jgi:hypothetical protein
MTEEGSVLASSIREDRHRVEPCQVVFFSAAIFRVINDNHLALRTSPGQYPRITNGMRDQPL